MEKKDIEIPFGAFDSELGGFEYTIPEGYKAEIKDGKVVVRKTESEDERIRKALKEYFINSFQNNGVAAICGVHIKDILAWLEKQQRSADKSEVDPYSLPISDDSSLPTFDESMYHPCTKEVYEQKSAWSEEDQKIWAEISDMLWEGFKKTYTKFSWNEIKDWIKPKIESIKYRVQSQSQWKPSKERMRVLYLAIRCGINRGTTEETTLVSLFNNLKKLREE